MAELNVLQIFNISSADIAAIRSNGEWTAILPRLPDASCGIRIEAEFAPVAAGNDACAVFAVQISQSEKITESAPVMTFPARYGTQYRVVLESCALIDPALPGKLTVRRLTGDPNDNFGGECAIAGMIITALQAPSPSSVVEDSPGYNSWPMCQSLNNLIVCTYSRGRAHNIYEPCRAVYARVSADGGTSWQEETPVCNTPEHADVTIGKGLDENGNMLLWVRRGGKDGFHHALYRSRDGKKFECISQVDLPCNVIQITDILHISGVGLMALYFGGSYQQGSLNFWGKLVSCDGGVSWQNTLIERNVPVAEWPTEPSAVYLGNGRILVIARNELKENTTRRRQFQLTSSDYGATWHKALTNITDVNISTPALIYNAESGTVSCCYFHRGKGVLNCRLAQVEDIFDSPLNWPPPETVAIGSCEVCEAGNVNATTLGGKHILAYYSGAMPNPAVYVKTLDAN